MKTARIALFGALVVLALAPRTSSGAEPAIPHLKVQGTATQLIVDGVPFLIRGGELGNSAATNPNYLKPSWEKFRALHMNTVLVPVYWDLIEPEERRFDFTTVDQVVAQAREHSMRLVLLWFGSWKNSMSCYTPAWVKTDARRFPRATDLAGTAQESLSPFSPVNRDTDARAFAALMKHVREIDETRHTVLMVQVENEIGMIPTARDHNADANRAFASPVPDELMRFLTTHQERVTPEVRAAWQSAGGKRSGTWSDVFGSGPAGEEIFMAWHFARYTDAVTAAGKKECALPMFANAALIRPGHQPGQYPSAGPLPHLADVWRAGAPSLDFLAPDIYFQNFAEWVRRYRKLGSVVFIPEAMRSADASVNGLFAFGGQDALGFSPFGIEAIGEPAATYLAASFSIVEQLEPLILKLQGLNAMAGLLSEGPEQRQPQQNQFGSTVLRTTFELTSGPSLADGVPAGAVPTGSRPSGGLILATGPDEFIIAGTAVTVTFSSTEQGTLVGILSAEEGEFVNGRWQNTRWLGGDETHQGRHIRLEPGRFSMQRVKIYRYR
jgi:hypothetical protein